MAGSEVNIAMQRGRSRLSSTAVPPGDEFSRSTGPVVPLAALRSAPEIALEERLARLREDFSRYRERVHREREEDRYRVQNQVILELLPVLDNFERGLSLVQEGLESSEFQGFSLIHKQLLQTLADLDVHPMQTLGEAFDPNRHESVMREPVPGTREDTVVRELLRGYTRGATVLRHAQVVVCADSVGEVS